ncbi:MAG: LysR family transcriptional regulator [Pseudomonadota bacterium]
MNNTATLELASLRCLIALMRERSVTRAARRLGLSQPAVSHILASLRGRFDDALFVRSAGGMLPTPRALEIVEAATEIVEAVDRLASDRRRFDPARERCAFVITVPEYFERVLAPSLLSRLQAEAPGVTVELRAPNPDLSRAWLDSGEVDFRIAWIHDPWPESRFARLPEDRFVCLVRQDHPQVGERLRVDDFFGLPHVRPAIAVKARNLQADGGTLSLEQYLGVTHRLRDATARHAGRRIRVVMLAQSFATLPHLVVESDAIATIPQRLARAIDPRLPIRVMRPPLAFPTVHGALYWHERTNTDPRHRWFRRLLLEVARRTTSAA